MMRDAAAYNLLMSPPYASAFAVPVLMGKPVSTMPVLAGKETLGSRKYVSPGWASRRVIQRAATVARHPE